MQGDEEAARRRLSQTVRANLAEEFNKRTVHEAISTERDKIMTETRQKADADAATIGVEVVDVRLRRVELPPDVTGPVYRADGIGAPARRQRAALARRRRNRRRSAPTPTGSAR